MSTFLWWLPNPIKSYARGKFWERPARLSPASSRKQPAATVLRTTFESFLSNIRCHLQAFLDFFTLHAFRSPSTFENHEHEFNNRKWTFHVLSMQTSPPYVLEPVSETQDFSDTCLSNQEIHADCLQMLDDMCSKRSSTYKKIMRNARFFYTHVFFISTILKYWNATKRHRRHLKIVPLEASQRELSESVLKSEKSLSVQKLWPKYWFWEFPSFRPEIWGWSIFKISILAITFERIKIFWVSIQILKALVEALLMVLFSRFYEGGSREFKGN